MVPRGERSDELLRFLCEASSERDNPLFGDDWGPLVEEVERAAELHRSDPSQPLLTIGRFEALEACGVGGQGVVIRARDPKLERFVALKLCRLGTAEAAQRLVREARTLARLSHPNIVTIHELGDDGDRVFLVMELIEDGATLSALIAQRPPWQVIVRVLCEAGRGLAAAHREGIVHRDFKPDNVLDAFGRPRVADFGLAGEWLEHEVEPRRAGTLGYMAPEVLAGQACTPKADQFSFCVTLLQALNYGALPGNLVPEIVQPVPAGLRRIVRRGLSVEPGERFASMDELVDALEGVLAPAGGRRKVGWVAFAGALGGAMAVGLALFALARGEGSVVEPVELPYPHNLTSMCAMGDEEVSIGDEELLGVCAQIRNGQLQSAQTAWDDAFNKRLSGDPMALAEGTLIVARTFVDHADKTWDTGREDARIAAEHGRKWAWEVVVLMGPRENADHPRAAEIKGRAEAILSRYSQHSTTPLSSTLP